MLTHNTQPTDITGDTELDAQVALLMAKVAALESTAAKTPRGIKK